MVQKECEASGQLGEGVEERGAVPQIPGTLGSYFQLQLGVKRLGTASCSNRTGGLMLAVSFVVIAFEILLFW